LGGHPPPRRRHGGRQTRPRSPGVRPTALAGPRTRRGATVPRPGPPTGRRGGVAMLRLARDFATVCLHTLGVVSALPPAKPASSSARQGTRRGPRTAQSAYAPCADDARSDGDTSAGDSFLPGGRGRGDRTRDDVAQQAPARHQTRVREPQETVMLRRA
jgi:hypothetical protein